MEAGLPAPVASPELYAQLWEDLKHAPSRAKFEIEQTLRGAPAALARFVRGEGEWAGLSPGKRAEIAASAVPVVGDVLGVKADLAAMQDEGVTAPGLGLLALGLLPFVPSRGQVRELRGAGRELRPGSGSGSESGAELLANGPTTRREVNREQLAALKDLASGRIVAQDPGVQRRIAAARERYGYAVAADMAERAHQPPPDFEGRAVALHTKTQTPVLQISPDYGQVKIKLDPAFARRVERLDPALDFKKRGPLTVLTEDPDAHQRIGQMLDIVARGLRTDQVPGMGVVDTRGWLGHDPRFAGQQDKAGYLGWLLNPENYWRMVEGDPGIGLRGMSTALGSRDAPIKQWGNFADTQPKFDAVRKLEEILGGANASIYRRKMLRDAFPEGLGATDLGQWLKANAADLKAQGFNRLLWHWSNEDFNTPFMDRFTDLATHFGEVPEVGTGLGRKLMPVVVRTHNPAEWYDVGTQRHMENIPSYARLADENKLGGRKAKDLTKVLHAEDWGPGWSINPGTRLDPDFPAFQLELAKFGAELGTDQGQRAVRKVAEIMNREGIDSFFYPNSIEFAPELRLPRDKTPGFTDTTLVRGSTEGLNSWMIPEAEARLVSPATLLNPAYSWSRYPLAGVLPLALGAGLAGYGQDHE